MSGQRPSVGPPRSTHATYHPDGYGVSEGLKRARRPFLLRNAVTGGAILGFVVG
jgi:cytochrome c oxidase assembly factor 3